MSYLLILILFICIMFLYNKCNELEINLTRKIDKLSEKIEKIQKKNIHNKDIPVEKNQSAKTITSFDFEQQENKSAHKQPEETAEKSALVSSKYENKQICNQTSKEFSSEAKENISFNFEKLFMENIFNKIGAIALVIGMGIFVKIISPFIVFTPAMQIATGFIVGLGLLFTSIKIHKDKLKNYAEVLMGTGFAILFLTTYCSCTIYSILPIWAATAVGSLLVVATYFVAEKYNSFATILIGLFGGYLNPFLIKSDISMTFIFSYLIFVNIIGIIYTSKNRDKNIVNCLNLFLTTIVITLFSISTNAKINIILPFLLWGTYIFNNFTTPEKNLKGTDIALTWINFTSLFWFINHIFQYKEPLISGLILTSIGIAYGIGAYFIKQKNHVISTTYIYNLLLSIGFAIFFIKNPSIRFFCWIIEVLAILYFARRNKIILSWSNLFLIVALIQSCLMHNEYARLGSLILCLFISIVARYKLDKNLFVKTDWLFFIVPLITTCLMSKGVVITSIFATMAFILKITSEEFKLEKSYNKKYICVRSNIVRTNFSTFRNKLLSGNSQHIYRYCIIIELVNIFGVFNVDRYF